MIVLGSRGRSDLGGLLLDSVAHKVIQLSICPVLVVRDEQSSTALAVANHAIKPVVVVVPEPRDPPPAGLYRVLVPLDGTPDAARAVEQAMRWFAGSGVAIVSLHVFDVATVSRFWDRPEHDHAAWSREFLARNAPAAGRHLESAVDGRPTGSWRWPAPNGPT